MADDVTHDSIDWNTVSGLPERIVAEVDVDRIEIALSAAIPLIVLRDDADGPDCEDLDAEDKGAENQGAESTDRSEVVLLDRQRTPLAVAVTDGSSPPRQLRLRHHGHSQQWDPALRRGPADVRAAVAGKHVLAVVFDELPTRADIARAEQRSTSGGFGAVLWVALVGHGGHGSVGGHGERSSGGEHGEAPSHSALARAVAGSATEASIAADVIPLAIPWARTMPGSLRLPNESADSAATLESVLALFGADEVMDATAAREPDELDALAAAEATVTQTVAELYPDASAREWMSGSRRERNGRGTVILFTGLSGSGKSTLAHTVAEELREHGNIVTMLDGDDVRQNLSAGLGFDRESRSINVRRIGYVAALVSQHGGIAVAAPIAPFADDRADVRERAERVGDFVLVHVSTPLSVCEQRDRKGLYARARAGDVPEFTGISSPYETPLDADVTIDTSVVGVTDGTRAVLDALRLKR